MKAAKMPSNNELPPKVFLQFVKWGCRAVIFVVVAFLVSGLGELLLTLALVGAVMFEGAAHKDLEEGKYY